MSRSTRTLASGPLGHRFLVVWAGQSISTVGSTMTGVGVAVWVFLGTGSLVWLGALAAVQALPAIAVTTVLRAADRLDRRRLMILADLVAGLGTAGALAVAAVAEIGPWHLAVAGLVGGFGTAVQVAAYQAAVPHLVAPDAVDRANGLVQMAPAIGIVLGPAFATPIVAAWGVVALLVVDLTTFAVGLLATLSTRFDAPPRRDGARADGPEPGGDATRGPVDEPVDELVDDGSLRAAVAWLGSVGRSLLVLLVAMAVVNACLAFFNVGFLAIAIETGGAARAGVPIAVGGVSMVIASLVVGARGLPERRVRVIVWAWCVLAGACVVVAVTTSFGAVVAVAAVSFGTVPIASAAVTTIFHEHVPTEMHVRVFGLRSAIGQGLYPLGTMLAGLTGSWIAAPILRGESAASGLTATLVGGREGREGAILLLLAAAGLVATTVLALGRPELRTIDRAGTVTKQARLASSR